MISRSNCHAVMAGGRSKRVLEPCETIRFNDRTVLSIFCSGDAFHRIRVQILQTHRCQHAIGITLIGLRDMYAISDRLGFVRESDGLRERLSARLGVDQIHEGCRLNAAQGGRAYGAIAKLRGARATG